MSFVCSQRGAGTGSPAGSEGRAAGAAVLVVDPLGGVFRVGDVVSHGPADDVAALVVVDLIDVDAFAQRLVAGAVTAPVGDE